MMDSSRLTFSRKGSIAKIGFAPWRVAAALASGCRLAVPRGEPHRCIYVCRCADDPGQAAGGCRRQTEFVYSSALLRCGPTMPSWHRTRAHPNQWYDISGPRKPRATPCESTARVASVSFLDGMASET